MPNDESALAGGEDGTPIDQSIDTQVMPRLRQTVVRHLPYFLIVAQEEHFHRAATLLNVTQSALSRRIQSLEHDLGTPLFDRRQRGVVLTDAGRVLYEDVQRILADIDRAVGRVRAVKEGHEGRLRIGLNESAARNNVVTEAIRRYKLTYPRVRVELLLPMLSEEQLVALETDAIDAGIFFDLKRDERVNQQFSMQVIDEEFMVLALSALHPLASAREIAISDLREEALIWPSRNRGRNLYNQMAAAFLGAGVPLAYSMEVLTADMTVNLAAAQLGMGFVPQSQPVPVDVVLRSVKDFNVPLRLHVAWRMGNQRTTLARLLDLIEGCRQGKRTEVEPE